MQIKCRQCVCDIFLSFLQFQNDAAVEETPLSSYWW